MGSRNIKDTAYERFETMSSIHPGDGVMAEVSADFDFSNVNINDRRMPVVPVRDIVIFPFLTVNINVSNASVLDTLDRAHENNEAVLALTVKNDADTITSKDLYRIGVVCIVVKIMELPDGGYMAIL